MELQIKKLNINPGGMQGGVGGYGPYAPYNSGYPNQFNGQQPNINANANLPFQVPPILQQQQPYFGGGPSPKEQQPLQNPLFMPNNANSATADRKPGEIESGNSQRLQPQQSHTTTVPRLEDSQFNLNANSNTKQKSSSQTEKTAGVPIEGGGGVASLEAENRLEEEILKSLKHQPYEAAETAAVHLGNYFSNTQSKMKLY